MDPHDDRLPDHLQGIADRLRANRAKPTQLELDALQQRIARRAGTPAPARRRGLGALVRRNVVALAMTLGLLATSGTGVVIACSSLGGGGGGHEIFSTMNFHHPRDSAGCQYHGPVSWTRVIHAGRVVIVITYTWNCGHVTVTVSVTHPYHYWWDRGPHRQHGNDDDSWSPPSDAQTGYIDTGDYTIGIPFDGSDDVTTTPDPSSGQDGAPNQQQNGNDNNGPQQHGNGNKQDNGRRR